MPDAGGLSSREAAARLARDGGNVLPSDRPTPLWRRIAAQLRDPLVLVLLAAAVLTLATADFTDAAVILLVIVVNTTVGVLQEVRAERAITALSSSDRAGRPGGPRRLGNAQSPPRTSSSGDLLVLAEGDIVPADATARGGGSAAGRRVRADRRIRAGGQDAARPGPATPRLLVVSAGTVVVRGRGRAVVTADRRGQRHGRASPP